MSKTKPMEETSYSSPKRYHLTNFLKNQRNSWQWFLREGIRKEFAAYGDLTFKLANGRCVKVTFNADKFKLVRPERTIKDCICDRVNYSSALYMPVSLDAEDSDRHFSYWICVSHLPLMTNNGHFIINGNPRVILNQLVRSPGVYFRLSKKKRLVADFIPMRGAWLRLEMLPSGETKVLMKNVVKLSINQFLIASGLNLKLISPYINQFLNTKNTRLGPALGDLPVNIQCNLTQRQKKKMLVDLALKLYGVDSEPDNNYVEKPDILSLFCCNLEHMFQFKFRSGLKPSSYGVYSYNDLRSELKDYDLTDASVNQNQAKLVSPTLSSFLKHRLKNMPKAKLNYPEIAIDWLNYAHQRKQFYNGSLYKSFWRREPNTNRFFQSNSTIQSSQTFQSQINASPKSQADVLKFYFATNKFRQKIFQPFFKYSNYSLSFAGRAKLNKTLGLSLPLNLTALTALDVLFGYFYLLECAYNNKVLSDIDHLENRCVRSMGELLQNQMAIGLQQLVQQMKSKLPKQSFFDQLFWQGGNSDYEQRLEMYKNWVKQNQNQNQKQLSKFPTMWPSAKKRRADHRQGEYLSDYAVRKRLSFWIQANTIDTVIKGFFGTNPLSQFLDMTNGLAELTHKRRLSALGIGGVERSTATMDIRGIHSSHYGRICPIETPEGKNAGLVNSFTSHALLSGTGEIKTPYYPCHNGIVFDEATPVLFGPQDEKNWSFGSGDVERSHLGLLIGRQDSEILPVPYRKQDQFNRSLKHDIDYIALNPIQMISVATSHIPFLEHNDGNRALMGSNMQRQAVPIIKSQRPIVGTGFECQSVSNIGLGCHTKEAGFIGYVDGERIAVYTQVSEPKHNVNRSVLGDLSINKASDNQTPNFFNTITNIRDLYTSMLLNVNSMANIFKKSYGPARLSSDKASKLVSDLVPLQHGQVNSMLKPGYFQSQFWHYDQSVFYGGEKAQLPQYCQVKLNTTPGKMYRFAHKSSCYTPKQKTVGYTPQVHFQGGGGFEGRWSFYKLDNFFRSNQGTYRVHRPSVDYGDWVRPGDLLADNTCSSQGELSVGQNILVGYTPWQGYNFEDAILLNQRMIYDDVFTSLHIERYTVNIRDTEFGSERLYPTMTGPLKKNGVVPVGTWVHPGSTLASKYAPSTPLKRSPHEILLFDVLRLPQDSKLLRNTSVYTPHDVYGRVIHVDYIQSKTKDKLARERNLLLRRSGYKIGFYHPTDDFYYGSRRSNRLSKTFNKVLKLSPEVVNALKGFDYGIRRQTRVYKLNKNKFTRFKEFRSASNLNKNRFQTNFVFAECPHVNVIKVPQRKSLKKKYVGQVLIYIAIKRRVQVGDKLSGRHGNKGIISRILPREDMPYLQDGTPLDIVLNPLGVPSRMNVGQIFETLLGFAGSFLHENYKICPFDEIYGCEASRSLVYSKLYQARLATNQSWLFNANYPGKVRLFDGITGQCFDQPVTVGKSYILKLIHMVDEKIHARSTGPYSLITQQPVRGRSKQGGQRFGEMEGWAIEGYAAAYVLHELFNIKSDDLIARQRLQKDIIFEKPFTYSIPEAFRVLMLELRSLCTDFHMFDNYSLNNQYDVFANP